MLVVAPSVHAQTTKVVAAQFMTESSCYAAVMPFNFANSVTITYSASGPMTLYFIPNGQIEMMNAFGGAQAWPNTLQGCDTKDLAQNAQIAAASSGTTGSFTLSGSGTITEQNLEPLQNPWLLVVIAPISDSNPSLKLSVGPVI